MAAKDKVFINIESFGSNVKLVIVTEKRGEMVVNLEVETKELVIVDKRIAERLALVGSTDLQ